MKHSIGRAVAAMLLFSSAALAQSPTTSSSAWTQRINPAAPKAQKSGKKVTSSKVEPSQAPKEALKGGAAVAQKASLGPISAPVSANPSDNDDTPYEAFDQGKYLTALSLAAKRAQKGDPQAHTLVARIHAEGFGVPQDLKLAAQWYARAVELGDTEAAVALGTMYARGEGVPQDYEQAAKLFEKAALKRHAEACYNLALLFLAGKGKPESPIHGFQLMQFAAEQGVTAAMYDLGTLHATGTGTEPNVFEAAKWFGKAANAGLPEAQVEFAIILLKDHDVPADQKEKLRHRAVELLRSAASKGISVAQNRLAHCYENGLGVPVDLREAAKWHYIAKAQGLEDADLEKAIGKLSVAERQKAQGAAAEWREQTLLE